MSHTIYPGYEVTEDGRVFSVSTNWRGYGRRQLTPSPNDDGYPSVRIYVDGNTLSFAVHVLVARAFLPPRPPEAHDVRHLDGDKENSSASNLAWGTQKENAADRERHGRTSRGQEHSVAIKRGLATRAGGAS